MNLFTGRQARPQASTNSLKWLWISCRVFSLRLSQFLSIVFTVFMLQIGFAQEVLAQDMAVSDMLGVANKCQSSYGADGMLNIPCVRVSRVLYAATLQQLSATETQFTLMSAIPVEEAQESKNVCEAIYSLETGRLDIPCISDNSDLVLYADNISNPNLFIAKVERTRTALRPNWWRNSRCNAPSEGDKKNYCSEDNPFKISNYDGQCTAHAWGRAYAEFGINLSPRRHAGTWVDSTVIDKVTGKTLETGNTPRANSIAVWKYGTYGHVAYVEDVIDGRVYFTESNWNPSDTTGSGMGYQDNIGSLPISSFEARGTNKQYVIAGYIYLQQPTSTTTSSTADAKYYFGTSPIGSTDSTTDHSIFVSSASGFNTFTGTQISQTKSNITVLGTINPSKSTVGFITTNGSITAVRVQSSDLSSCDSGAALKTNPVNLLESTLPGANHQFPKSFCVSVDYNGIPTTFGPYAIYYRLNRPSSLNSFQNSISDFNFTWSSVSGANAYRVLVTGDSLDSIPNYDTVAPTCPSPSCFTTATSSTSYNYRPTSPLIVGKKYCVYVRAGTLETSSILIHRSEWQEKCFTVAANQSTSNGDTQPPAVEVPDLALDDISIYTSPSQIKVNQPFRVDTVIKNYGKSVSPQTNLTLYLSQDTNIDPATDTHIGSISSVKSLSPNENTQMSSTLSC